MRRTAPLPERVDLPAIGQSWAVVYASGAANTVTARERDGRLVLSGKVHDARACHAALRRWLSRKTRAELGALLHDAAEETGLPHPQRIRVGFPRTRWASCSSRGTVSLSARSLFLPERLVRYVLVHELCHLVHLDHSPRFYALLERHAPGHAVARKEMKEAWRLVPVWVEEQSSPQAQALR